MTTQIDGEAVLKEMVDGLEGVTAGPWEIRRPDPDRPTLIADYDCHPIARLYTTSTYPGQEGKRFDVVNLDADGPHLARCTPENIRAIATYVEALEAENKALREALRAHHNHQSDLGIIFTKDDAGEFHEIDMSDGYAESGLCSQTIAALKRQQHD